MTADNNINKLLKSVSPIDIQKIRQNQNGKIDSRNNNGSGVKSFEDVLKAAANANANTNTMTANDIKLRQYEHGLHIKPAFPNQEQELTFSKHAQQRLAQRNIDIDTGLIERINGAVRKASEKSIKNALVLSGESAFIVSVDNNVVVTAMNSQEMKENVITNIDGTVIL